MNPVFYSMKLARALIAKGGSAELTELTAEAERDLATALLTGAQPGESWSTFADFVRNAAVKEPADVFERLVNAVTSVFVLNAMLATVTGTGRSGAIRALVAHGATETALTEPQKRFLRSVYGSTWRPSA